MGIGFVWFWVAVAAACGLLGTGAAVHSYLMREDEFDRRRTRRVMAQFAPCVLAASGNHARRRPCSGIHHVASRALGRGVRPRGDRHAAAPAVGDWAGWPRVCPRRCGTASGSPGDDPSGWAVGGVFGVGHLVTAFVLWHGMDESPMSDATDGRFAYDGT